MILLRSFSVLSVIISIITFNIYPDVFRYFIFLPFAYFILLIRNTKHNLPLVLFFIYGILFYLYLLPKFLFDFPIVYYFEYDNIYYYNKALLINIIFLSSIGLFIKPFNSKFKFPDYSNLFQPNHYVVIFNVVIMVLIMLFGFSGNSIMSDASYGSEDFGSKSIFTEYYIIFLIFAYSHSKSFIMKWGVIILASLMVIICLLYGSRISALLTILTIFLLHFPNRFSITKLLIAVFSGLLIMNLMGAIRAGGPSENTDFSSLIRFKTEGIMSSTQSNMYYGSVTFVGLIEDGVFDPITRIKSLIGFTTRLFLPSSLCLEEGSLATYGQTFSPWGGGGHPATYFYVWFGWAGPVIFGILIAKLMNQLKRITFNKYSFFMAVILLATFPRWFGYEPGIIFKMTWVGIVILIIQENIFFKPKFKKNDESDN